MQVFVEYSAEQYAGVIAGWSYGYFVDGVIPEIRRHFMLVSIPRLCLGMQSTDKAAFVERLV